jgi:hypothetical protein
MNRRAVGPTVLAAVVVLTGATALAQQDPAPAPSASGQAPPVPTDSATPPPAGSGDAPAGSGAPAPASSGSAKGGSVMGYAYNDHAHAAPATAPAHRTRMVRHAGEALATFTGFEMLADGGSRLFVQLNKAVEVEQTKDVAVAPRARARKGKAARPAAATNRLVFILKGAELGRSNDSNSLETVHFNTPVLRARLVPAGKDLRLVVVLRADATPTLKSVAAKDNGSIVQIDFPQGTYLPPGDSLVSPESGTSGAKEPVQGALPSNDSSGNSGQGSGPTP